MRAILEVHVRSSRSGIPHHYSEQKLARPPFWGRWRSYEPWIPGKTVLPAFPNNQFHTWRMSQSGGTAKNTPDGIRDHLSEYLSSNKASSSQMVPKVRGEIMQASAAATGNVVNQAGTTIDTLGGGRYQADQSKMAQKEDDMQSTIAQQVVDASKSAKERDLKNFSDALDTVKQATQRWASVIDKIG